MENGKKSQSLQLSISWRLIAIILLAVIGLMLAAWRPWTSTAASSRVIAITGEATVSAEPDELVFYPYFEVKDTQQLTQKAATITDGLKKLGVEEKYIKTNASSYEKYLSVPEGSGTDTLTLQFTVTITANKELSQKVQDFLVAQNPKGQISPQASFSTEKRKQLTDQATVQATADAKTRADKMAAELGAKIGKVVKVSEATSMFPYALEGRDMAVSQDSAASKLPISVGENDFTYQLQVEFELR
ncbi:MAG: SIMPL domain-containing protein [bacterium]|nr:SIMPL domain-containing protein [bacterium]